MFKRTIKRMIPILIAIAVGFYLLIAAFLFLYQDRIVYNPTRYDNLENDLKSSGAQKIEYTTSQGKQLAFYIPPAEDPSAPPERLWIAFTGNSGRVLDWMDLIQKFPDQRAAFLLTDYPGYGACNGKPSIPAIDESIDTALDTLAAKINLPRADLETRLCVVGHSLGAGMALQLTRRHPVQRVVLISPFTSLRAMGRRRVGVMFMYLLRHNLDNVARLNELEKQTPPPNVLIIHGEHDEVIPVEMGRELAAAHPKMITYVEVSKEDHNAIVTNSRARIWQAMTETIVESDKVRN
ncbi:MAG: alpha/beta fold hydrolase [Candidatus Sumerlaeota bacterium]